MSSAVLSKPTAPPSAEPVPLYLEELQLWVYGNTRLLDADLVYVEKALGKGHLPRDFNEIEERAEVFVLGSKILVCGVHSPAHQRAAVVPLRWGSPRIVVFSGGFHYHLGPNLTDEAFRAARLWRYEWDPKIDLAVSRRSPDKLPTYATHNPTVDRLIVWLTHSSTGEKSAS